MRLVDGRDLAQTLHDLEPLAPERAVAILDQLAAAVDAIHDAGMVHRDVKPAHVMLTSPPAGGSESAGDYVYLTDFGLARNEQSAGLTRTGTFVGTVDYAAPELLRGALADPAS